MTEIIIWRHAEAEVTSESGLDSERALTRKGREDAHCMAKWLKKHLPANIKIYCSPALRCVQTVEALMHLSQKKHQWNVQLADVLSLESNARAIRQQLIRANTSAVLLIGHQPILGHLVAELLHESLLNTKLDASLLGFNHSTSSILLSQKTEHAQLQYTIKKGAVWWLRHRNHQKMHASKALELSEEMYVLTVQDPKFLPNA